MISRGQNQDQERSGVTSRIKSRSKSRSSTLPYQKGTTCPSYSRVAYYTHYKVESGRDSEVRRNDSKYAIAMHGVHSLHPTLPTPYFERTLAIYQTLRIVLVLQRTCSVLYKVPSQSPYIYSFAFGPSVVGRSRSLISPAASLSQKLMRSLPNPLLTMLN